MEEDEDVEKLLRRLMKTSAEAVMVVDDLPWRIAIPGQNLQLTSPELTSDWCTIVAQLDARRNASIAETSHPLFQEASLVGVRTSTQSSQCCQTPGKLVKYVKNAQTTCKLYTQQ